MYLKIIQLYELQYDKQGFQFFYTGQYKDGEKVKVFYNKEDPYHFYVDSKQSEMFGRIIGAVIGLVIIIIGLYQLLAVDDSLQNGSRDQ